MEASGDVASFNAVKGLRLLEEIERDKGDLYEAYSATFLAGSAVSALFGRLSLDQASRRNVIQYQTRVVARNRQVFLNLSMPIAPIARLQDLITGYHCTLSSCTRDDAIAAARELEERTLELHAQFPRALGEHFGPFLASLTAGSTKHLQLLEQAANGGEPPVKVARARAASENEAVQPAAPGRGHPVTGNQKDVDDLLDHMDRSSMRTLLDVLPQGAFIATEDRRIIYWNPAAEHITGFAGPEMVGHACHDNGLNHVGTLGCPACHEGCPLLIARDGRVIQSQRMYVHHKEGHRVPVTVTVCPIGAPSGSVLGFVQLFSKETSDDWAADAEKLALLDPLTQVAHRSYVESVLLSRLAELQRHGWSFGVILLGLDTLAGINSSRGHGAGDRLLRMVAHTLAANVRASDVVGRWAGDQFLTVLSNVDEKKLAAVTRKLRMVVERSDSREDHSSVPTAVSVSSVLARPEDTVETLLCRCEERMASAGREGTGQPDQAAASEALEADPARRKGARSLLARAARLVMRTARS